MGRRHWVRTTKCQLLVTSLFVMLLGLAITILTVITRYGAHFSIISGVSYEANPYRIFHNVAFYSGICLSMILVLAALLSTVATVRESVCLMAVGFFCFAIVFCALIQAAFWRYTNNSEVEDAMMDVYDSVYEEVRRNLSSFRRQELATIHETFLCCGKQSPFGETGGIENETCPSEHMGTAREDCLQEIQDFLKKHMDFVSALLIITICFMLAGGIILGVALWLRHDSQTTSILYLHLGEKQAPNTFYIGIYILIAVGAVMMFVGFLGCYGAIQESQCLLGTFFTCLVILFACEVAAGIWGFVNKDLVAKDVKQFYDQALQQAVQQELSDSDTTNAKTVVKTFHETLDCCGANTMMAIGASFIKNDLCPKEKNLLETLSQGHLPQDCHKKIDELFSEKLYLIGIAAIVVAVIMIFEMILSMILCCGIRNSTVY